MGEANGLTRERIGWPLKVWRPTAPTRSRSARLFDDEYVQATPRGAQFCCVTGCRQCVWQQWVEWKTDGTGYFTLEKALPLLSRGALSRRVGFSTPPSVDVVLRHLEEPALQDDAWAVATAVAESGHVDYDDEASVFEWAAATAAALRRVAHG